MSAPSRTKSTSDMAIFSRARKKSRSTLETRCYPQRSQLIASIKQHEDQDCAVPSEHDVVHDSVLSPVCEEQGEQAAAWIYDPCAGGEQ